uniref:UDENN domain-containing protein n=1 Tax=Plectus sambesii TaxID=2011161 RepID=A0A914W5L8_9BILA
MIPRLLCFLALLAMITTCSMAFQCYSGEKGSTDTTSCPSDWCLTATTLSGVVLYSCDNSTFCSQSGSGCIDNKIIHNFGYQSLCCCQTNLCNYDVVTQCYAGVSGSEEQVPCNSGWCLKGTTTRGQVGYDCDTSDVCTTLGKGCYENQMIQQTGCGALFNRVYGKKMSLQERSDMSVAGVDADRLGRPVETGEVTPTGSATSTGSAASRIRQASDDAPSASSTTISTAANQSYMDATLPWDKFSNWVHCICVVTFDLELGQALEVVYPGYCNLTATEKMNICYLAFPDSNSGCTGDTRFHFRMRRFSGKSLNTAQEAYDQRAPVYLQTDPVHYFGFVHFRQTKDKTIPRGYLQKSVVLVTLLPLVNLFTHVVETIAPRFFESGEPAIEAACHDIDQWPAPQPGVTFNLPLMGSIVQCRIPSHYDMPNYQKPLVVTAQESTHLAPTLLPTVHEPQLFENLAPIVPHLQLLWELVLIGEPLVAMSPSPTHCSGVVQSLVSLIWPLRYCYDYRPFFTIHDSEFKEYTSKTQAPPKVVLGVTNPFFTKTLQHWPHIVRIGDANAGQATTAAAAKVFKKSTDGRTLDTKPGLYSQYKPFLAKDKALLKRILK